jgi:hypothetical protein
MKHLLDFPAVIFASRTFQKDDLSSGMLRIDWRRFNSDRQDSSDSSAPRRLLLSSTHRHFANYHFRLPARRDRRTWQAAFHLSDPHFNVNPKLQFAQVTPLFVLSAIDLRDRRLPIVLANLMNDRSEPYADISIRELIAAYDNHSLQKSRR